MQNSVLNTAYILVNRQPFVSKRLIKRCVCVFGVCVSEVVPAWADECIHGISFSCSFAAAYGTGCFKESFWCKDWWFALNFEIYVFRQFYRKLVFRYRLRAAFFAINYRNRSTPVSLTRNKPVAQPVLGFKFAVSAVYSFLCNSFFGFVIIHAVKFFWIYKHTRVSVCRILAVRRVFRVFNNHLHRKVIFFCKIEVSFIVRRYSHYSTCTVFNKSVIRSPKRKFFAVKRVDSVSTKRYACFNAFSWQSFDFCHFTCVCTVVFNSLFLFGCCEFFNIFVLGCNNKVGDSVNCIRTGCINRDFHSFDFFYFKFKNSALWLANPVFLHCFNRIRPAFEFVNVFKKYFCVVSDF